MKRLALAAAAMTLPGAAFAHPGHTETSGLASGFLHPVTGPDHLLAMLAVGLIAALCGGRMLWALPVTFVGAMLAGAGPGLAGLALPGVEIWILGSVIVLGLLAAIPSTALPHSLLLAGTALFGLFHGYAHGAEAPTTGSLTGYLIGFTLATAALHGIGIMLGQRVSAKIARSAGAAIALAGAGLALIG
ncbi:HupE/UreJ family protein [Xinfangfangia sp. D13-10-4-6]|uniref:HupE/UreJ family protein n=1 Tax=Pseudogemmobacter hezensis TaxID=2737662 RepID=UPI00155381BE|nr:HupE/UreJ family protein [Pseudogemmobacter hezensis]NPD16741.1 HupE/UreJ family protein [Pseudogemmobacter hezensis]